MPTPSLILVPARFKTGKLYTPVATTSGGVVLGASGDFNVTRATTATRVNASGLIESVASGIPRLDYFASGGVVGCPALLVEPSAQNIAQRSNELSTAPNVLEATTFSGNIFVSPDGTQNAARFTETTSSSRHGFYQYQTIASGAYTVSIFTKQTGRRYIAFTSDFSTGLAAVTSYFDLQTKSVLTNGSGHTGSVQDYGNGWLRLVVTIGTSVSGSRYVVWGGSPSGTTVSYVGDVNISQTFYGLQIETGSVATSYIPTTTAAVTRNADVISLSGAVSGCIGQTEGTIYAEVDIRAFAIFGAFISISDGTSNNRVELYKSLDKIFFDRTSSTQSVGTSIGSTSTYSPGILKIAVAYKSGDTIMYINGSPAVTTQTATFTFSSLTRINIGQTQANAARFNDRIRAAALYTTRLTNAELQSLTTL